MGEMLARSFRSTTKGREYQRIFPASPSALARRQHSIFRHLRDVAQGRIEGRFCNLRVFRGGEFLFAGIKERVDHLSLTFVWLEHRVDALPACGLFHDAVE